MAAPLSDEISWASTVGARLKAVQASFADDEDEMRRGYLAEEVQTALRDIPPTRRRAHLDALKEQFPTAEPGTEPSPAAPGENRADDSAESLIVRLASLADGFSPTEKRDMLQRLATAGLGVEVEVPGSGGSALAPLEIPPDLAKRLGLAEGQSLDAPRVLQLITLLVDLTVTIDHLAWNVWKGVAPNSVVRREGAELRKLVGPYLVGDREVSTSQISQQLNKARQLVASLLAAIGATGESFARQYLQRFSPGAIKDAASAEAGFFLGPEQKCWRKYLQLFDEMSGVQIENEINNAIARYAEGLIVGTSRSGRGPA